MKGASTHHTDPAALDEVVWETLVDSIVEGTCTPFLGAGVAVPYLPSGRALSSDLASEYGYPLDDSTNLARVTQYIATLHQQSVYVKRKIKKRIQRDQRDFESTHGSTFPDNYRMLARLRAPLYVTTNYDNFLTRALTAAGRSPHVQICRWNDHLREEILDYTITQPTVDHPVVFHLHGALTHDTSLLVTEDDYIDFMVSLAAREQGEDAVLAHWVRRALVRTNLLFIGYSLEDWNFRVLMRHLIKQAKIVRSEQWLSLSVQLADTKLDADRRAKAERFLVDYLGTSAIRVHWTSATQFLEELVERVDAAR